MNLLKALNPTFPICTAIVGAGGKTTAMFSLARQVEGPAWTTTTTHLGTDQMTLADRHFVLQSTADFKPEVCLEQKVTLLTGPFTQDGRVHSPEPEILELIHEAAGNAGVSLVLEADGSRSIPLKAPGDHEPPIPAWVRQVVVLVGFSALGRPLSDQTVFRAGRYGELTGLREGQVITPESVCRMLLHPLGGLKNVPAGVLKGVLFNQVESPDQQELARQMSVELLAGGYDRVIAGGLKSAPEELAGYSR